MSQEITFTGISGKKYTYQMFPRGTKFKETHPGLYIHAKKNAEGLWIVLRVGETKDLNQRLANHEAEEEVNRAGATHICVRVNSEGEPARLAEEKDLIQNYRPECNVQHNREVSPPATTRQVNPSRTSVQNPWLKL